MHGPEVTAKGLEKPLGEIVDKPLVIVDWHYTLVQDDQTVKQRDLDALELLLGKADVLILSYVGSKRRAAEVPVQVRELVPFHAQLAGIERCWQKCGDGRKTHFAWDNLAEAVFDDCRKICQECQRWGIPVYPINAPHQDHRWCGGGFRNFAEAVDQWIVDQAAEL